MTKKIKFCAIFITALFAFGLFSSVHSEQGIFKRNIQVDCWELKYFVKNIFKPLNMIAVSENMVERYKDGSPKKTYDLLVARDSDNKPIGRFFTVVTWEPKIEPVSTKQKSAVVCLLANF